MREARGVQPGCSPRGPPLSLRVLPGRRVRPTLSSRRTHFFEGLLRARNFCGDHDEPHRPADRHPRYSDTGAVPPCVRRRVTELRERRGLAATVAHCAVGPRPPPSPAPETRPPPQRLPGASRSRRVDEVRPLGEAVPLPRASSPGTEDALGQCRVKNGQAEARTRGRARTRVQARGRPPAGPWRPARPRSFAGVARPRRGAAWEMPFAPAHCAPPRPGALRAEVPPVWAAGRARSRPCSAARAPAPPPPAPPSAVADAEGRAAGRGGAGAPDRAGGWEPRLRPGWRAR